MQPTQQNAWHLTRGGQTYGPYTWEQIVQHARGGRIGRGDKLLDPRTNTWVKPSKVPGLFGPGGAATASVGLSKAAKIAAGIVLGMAILLGAYATLRFFGTDPATWLDKGMGIAQNTTPVTTTKAVMAPEGLTYKGTLRYQELGGPGVPNSWTEETCYLGIHTTDDGTFADLSFGSVENFPVLLVRNSGPNYVFESPSGSLVARVEIIAWATDTDVSGTVTTLNDVGSFVSGTFSGEAISYEQYGAECTWAF